MHQEDGYTHSDWFTATSRAALLKALETEWTTASNSAFEATTKHQDLFLHTLAHGGKTSSGATGYIRVTRWQAKPGADEALEAHVMKYIKPVLDTGVENGTRDLFQLGTKPVRRTRLRPAVEDGEWSGAF